jgi:AraC family transcriptional regulator
MNYLVHVQRGIDYIEAHLDRALSPAEVAAHAGISAWHYQRIFKALTRETLMTYIRSRRFAHALDLLATTDARILDIALGAGFETQETFTRAFKKAFAVTPASYRRRHQALPFLRKVRFDTAYLAHLHARVSLEPELWERPATAMVGLRTRFFGVESEKNNLARKIPPLWAAFLPRMAEVADRRPGTGFGVVRQHPDQPEELVYDAAVEVTGAAAVPPGMVRLELPAATYAAFTHRGPVADLDRTVNYIYGSWLLGSGMRHTERCDLEVYGPGYRPDSDQSVIHYAIPVEASGRWR